VQKGQADALAGVRPGADGQTLDATARAVIEGEDFDMPHGLGHGVGMVIHELPVLSRTATATLAVGNVVTVEPGAYLPGRGGIRIEDLVIVGEGGPEVLTPFTKDLLTVD
jgi:Xaa-Pro aminopeptidase